MNSNSIQKRKGLIVILLIAAVIFGAYQISAYTWRFNYTINQLTSFEKVLIHKTTGATWGDVIPWPENETTGQLIPPMAVPHRMVAPLVPGVDPGVVVDDPLDPRLGVPVELFMHAQEIGGKVVVLPLALATPFERTLIEKQGGALVAVVDPGGNIIAPVYHEKIHVPQKLTLNFAVSAADTAQLALHFQFLKVCIDIFAPGDDKTLATVDDVEISEVCLLLVDGGFVLFPLPLGGGVAQGDVVQSTILLPGDYGVVKKVWYFTAPVVGEVSGVFTIFVFARVDP